MLSMLNPEKGLCLMLMGAVFLSELRKLVWAVWKGLVVIYCAVSV